METTNIVSLSSPLGESTSVLKQTFAPADRRPVKRVSFVAGLHGDELEGVYLCGLLIQFLRKLQETQPGAFLGEVNVYPAANPAAINSGTRLWPYFSSDMNRSFGQKNGQGIPGQTSKAVIEDLISNSDLVVDLHASNLHLQELPQIRIIEKFADKLTPLAKHCGVDLVCIHPMAGLFESTLGYNLNKQNIPALVVETGTCLRINPANCEQIFAGMVNLLEKTGALALDKKSERALALDKKSESKIKPPIIVQPGQVAHINARASGLFISRARLGSVVSKGEPLGQIVDPARGEVMEDVVATCAGMLFTLREHPLVYEGALMARVAFDCGPLG